MTKEIYRRYLPHLHFLGTTFFMTWRLHGSLPMLVIEREQSRMNDDILKIQKNRASDEEKEQQINRCKSLYLQRLDEYLDKTVEGPHCLKQPDTAKCVMAKLHQYDGLYYRLEAFCVMSNHVHALLDFRIQIPSDGSVFDETKYVQLDRVMKYIKGGSAFECNKILNRTDTPFWDEPNFDRYIRNERHYNTTINYILNNPVKAGLCENWEDYPYTYLRPL